MKNIVIIKIKIYESLGIIHDLTELNRNSEINGIMTRKTWLGKTGALGYNFLGTDDVRITLTKRFSYVFILSILWDGQQPL